MGKFLVHQYGNINFISLAAENEIDIRPSHPGETEINVGFKMEGALEDYVSQLKNCVPSNYGDLADRCLKAKELTNDIREIIKNSEKSG